MLDEIGPEKRGLANLVAPIAPLLPNFWTDKGNKYRKRFLLWLAVFAALFLITATCFPWASS
jgi:hypothetical protein